MDTRLETIPGYPHYKISENGELFSQYQHRFLKPKIDKYGYKVYGLTEDGRLHHVTAHRLVATTYIPNPNRLPCVNHINEIKTDNRIENLEWTSWEGNANHGTRNERVSKTKSTKPVIQTLPDGKEVRHKGAKDGWRNTGIWWSCIRRSCLKGTPTSDKSKWRYANDTN